MSARARHICYFCDYGALSLYSLGCAFAYGAYAMPDHWVSGVLHHYFVPAAALNSFVCTGLSCYSRFPELERPRLSKVLRTAAFVYPFLYDNIPLFYRLLFCFWSNCAWNEAVAGYCYHLLFALLTGFLFASHLPERLAPGRFDYIGEQQPPVPRLQSPAPQSNPLQWELGKESQHPGLTLASHPGQDTATSSSTSVLCWAPTSSWRPSSVTCARAGPGCRAACPPLGSPAPLALPDWPFWAMLPSSAPSPLPCLGCLAALAAPQASPPRLGAVGTRDTAG
ncbi:membrane progestin receptor delta isoform 3-T4 [Spheniscus humboldti]